MTAEMLREAAALMRERAIKAQEQGGPGPWVAIPTIDPDNDGWVVCLAGDHDWDTTVARTPYDYEGTEAAPYIASWHPAVALAVADWLVATALLVPPDPHHEGEFCETCDNARHALTVARAYLGGDR